MSTTERLRDKYAYLWDRLFNHPFVVGIGSGELPRNKFQFYVKQDYYFLVQYNRMLALATAKAPDLENIGRFASLLNETLNVEMELHRTFSRKFDVSAEELEATRPAPITLAYTDYLLRVAYEGTLTDVIANLLPCQWVTPRPACTWPAPAMQPTPTHTPSGFRCTPPGEFTSFVDWLREFLDSLTEGAGGREMARLEEHFLTATRYEYLFWEMSYNLEDWPL